eukprot:jgi/Chrzof1/3647/Cz13g03200.t1
MASATAIPQCVYTATYWSTCDDADSPSTKCTQGWSKIPGGKGRDTLFFSQPNERSVRTLWSVISQPHATVTNGSSHTDRVKTLLREAGRQFVAAELNRLSGSLYPAQGPVSSAASSLRAHLALSAKAHSLSATQLQAVELSTAILSDYNGGTMEDGPSKCK